MTNLTSLSINEVQKRVTDVNFNINFFLHFLLLFSFLTIFFIFFLSKISTETFNGEVGNLIDDLLKNNVKELKKSPNFNNIVNRLPLRKLSEIYEKRNKSVEQHNNDLIKLVIIINVLLWTFFITIVCLLKFQCDSKLSLVEIILENLVIFTFVGLFEYYFFTRIALKFVPVEPSFISKQFMTNVKDKLK
jgi:hypothetical protein